MVGVSGVWRRDVALQAVRDWLEEHGHLPIWSERETASKGRPAARTIQQRWGWHKLLAKTSGESPDELRARFGRGRARWSES
jgi:hypothetical protein